MKKLNSRGFSLFEMLLALLIVGAIVGVGLFVYKNKVQTSNLSIQDLVSKVKADVSAELTNVKIVGAEDGAYNGTVHFKASGYDFMSSVETKDTLNYEVKESALTEDISLNGDEAAQDEAMQKDEEALLPVKKIITDLLKNNGFSEVSSYPNEAIIGKDGVIYERAGDVCAVNGGYSVGISCANKNSFTEAAQKVKPFVEAYRIGDSTLGEPEGTAFSLVETGTGTTSADKFAIVSTGIAAAYFYQKNGKWVYFTSSQEGIGCTDIASDPYAAKAFSKNCRKPGEGL